MSIERPKHLDSVLVVEDEEDHARLIIKSLKESINLKNDIIWIDNGKDAIDYLQYKDKYENSTHSLPGLILLDIKLPFKDGFEILLEVKSSPPLKSIPIVMLTTTSTGNDINRALALGANDYIVKPVSFEEFITKIKRLGYYWEFISDIKQSY